MKTRNIIIVTALLIVAVGAAGYYAGWLDCLRYLVVSPQTRERLDTEKLERSYSIEAKTFEQRLQTTLATDPEVLAQTKGLSTIVLNARQKLVRMLQDQVKSVNTKLTAISRPELPLYYFCRILDEKVAFPDALLIKEVRANLASDKPESIRTDSNDLIQRYRATVNVTFTIVRGDARGVTSEAFPISVGATPDKQWKFPSPAETKKLLLEFMTGAQKALQNELDETNSKLKSRDRLNGSKNGTRTPKTGARWTMRKQCALIDAVVVGPQRGNKSDHSALLSWLCILLLILIGSIILAPSGRRVLLLTPQPLSLNQLRHLMIPRLLDPARL